MNKKQRVILVIVAVLIFVSLLDEVMSFRASKFTNSIVYILLYGIPGSLLFLALRDREIKK